MGWKTPKKQGLLNTAEQIHIWTHRDWVPISKWQHKINPMMFSEILCFIIFSVFLLCVCVCLQTTTKTLTNPLHLFYDFYFCVFMGFFCVWTCVFVSIRVSWLFYLTFYICFFTLFPSVCNIILFFLICC